MSNELTLTSLPDHALQTYLSGMSEHTQRAYTQRLQMFLEWRAGNTQPFVAQLKSYIGYLQGKGLSPRSVQAHINTIKGLIRTAAGLDSDLSKLLPSLDLAKAPKVAGDTYGKRLTDKERQQLIDATPDTLIGKRDRAILGLLSIDGLRRSEVCDLEWEHLTISEGHHLINNLRGKHNRIRTVKLPVMLWRAIMVWNEASGLDQTGYVFVSITKGGKIIGKPLSGNDIVYLVTKYAKQAGITDVKPHDLRRSAASIARKNGASIEQVQMMLGHASPQTTSRYIGESFDLDDNGVDYSAKGVEL